MTKNTNKIKDSGDEKQPGERRKRRTERRHCCVLCVVWFVNVAKPNGSYSLSELAAYSRGFLQLVSSGIFHDASVRGCHCRSVHVLNSDARLAY